MTFLNEPGVLDVDGWDPPARSHLWRYNLHYFEDLLAAGAETRVDWHLELIADWIASNPAGQGTGWEPYPTSLRICNWIKWERAGLGRLDSVATTSLAVQVRWLTKRLEHHLLGNHLFVNAKALCLAGLHFTGAEAASWLATGLAILRREVPEQILADGGQFELSPMYHALAVEDVLDLLAAELACEAEGRDLHALLVPHLPDMLSWMTTMRHPDGEIALFNDAAVGNAPSPAELLAYANRMGFDTPAVPSARYLASSGYARLQAGTAILLTDLAAVGPDCLPGHAHADTLSFEMSLGRNRVIVNGGTSVYGTGDERSRQRGTRAHSTVTVADVDSSEVWAGFRVARRARVHRVCVDTEAGHAEGQHDGYRRLRGGGDHWRRWQLRDGELTVQDRVNGLLPAEARFHLHPQVTVAMVEGAAELALPGGMRASLRAEGVRAEASSYHPAFGIVRSTICLVVPLRGGSAQTTITWDIECTSCF